MLKVLITGGAGFVGSHLISRLQRKGIYNITVFDKLENHEPRSRVSSASSLQRKPGMTAAVSYFKGNVTSKKDLAKVFEKYGPFTTIFHLASAMPNKEVSDEEIWNSNVHGIQNLLEEAAKHKTKSFIFTSSNVTYGIPAELPTSESTPLLPLEVYGKSKAQAEKELEKYKDKMNIQIFRCPVITGTGRLGLQAILFEFISENKNIYVLGGGKNTYQFVDVDDVCQALEKASKIKGFDIYNIGADKTMTLRQIYQHIIRYAKSTSKIVSIPQAPSLFLLAILDRLNMSPLGVYQYTMLGRSFYTDTSKIKKKLGWQPKKTNLDTFLDNYKWYIEHKGEFSVMGKGSSANRSLPKMGILKLLKLLS